MIYNNSDILTTSIDSPFGAGKQYYKAKKFPPVPPAESDIYVVTTEGVRLDLRRALRKFDKHVQYVIDKYKLQIK